MKLLTKEMLKKLPQEGAQANKPTHEITLFAKLFTPWASWTWYIAEYDPATEIAYGFVQGFENEWGCFSLAELKEIKGPWGLTIERDRHFAPKKFSELGI
jgi:hypothetical protein